MILLYKLSSLKNNSCLIALIVVLLNYRKKWKSLTNHGMRFIINLKIQIGFQHQEQEMEMINEEFL